MAITNKDVDKLKEVFETKEDLKRFATKDDLNKFATKDDLKRFATRDDLDAKFKEVLAGQDQIMKELEKARQDRTLALGKDREQDRRLGDLEGKVQRIEEKAGV